MRSKSSKFCLLISAIISMFLQANLVLAQTDDQRMQKAKEYFAAGRELIRQGNYAAADNEFKKAQQLLGLTPPVVSVKAKPETPAVSAESAKAKGTAKTADSIKDPVSYYAKAAKLAPKNADLRYNLALEYIKISEYKLAEEELKRVIQLNNRDKDACYNLGVLYENYLGDRTQAIYYYSRYIGLDPRAEDAWRVRVWINDLKRQIASEK